MKLTHILHDKRTLSISLILFFATFIIYLLSYKGEGRYYNSFVLLADALLHDRLYLLSDPPWLNELVNIQNRFYVPYSPMPAIMLIPFVALFGTGFLQPILSILVGSINISLCFVVIKKFFNNEKLSFWIAILYAFGTIHWYHAEVGSSWYISHIIGNFFIWLALLEIKTKRRFFLIGLLVGFAFLSRLPTIFAAIFPIIYLFEKLKQKRNIVLYLSGLLVGILINSSYSFLAFGSFYSVGYYLIPNTDNQSSLRYIPIHLAELLTALPKFQQNSPFVIPSLNVIAIWFTTPAFLLAIFANFKKRLEFASLITIIAILFIIVIHRYNGYSQFGYRYLLDLYPFLLILVASGIRDRLTLWKKILIFLSILINFWGVLMISFFKIWTF